MPIYNINKPKLNQTLKSNHSTDLLIIINLHYNILNGIILIFLFSSFYYISKLKYKLTLQEMNPQLDSNSKIIPNSPVYSN